MSDPLREVYNLHVFGQGGNTIFGQFLVEVVLLDVLVNVGLKGETPTFRVEPVVWRFLMILSWVEAVIVLPKK